MNGIMNVISSRTPEGDPNKCPVCGNEVCVEPSLWFGDAPCPSCGHLLWFFRTRRETYFIEHVAASLLRDRVAAMASRHPGNRQSTPRDKTPAIGQSRSLAMIPSADQASLGLGIALLGMLALACLTIWHGYLNADTALFGNVASLAACFVGGVVWFMHWTEHRRRSFPAPSLKTSKLLVAMVPVVFWVPIFGMIAASAAIDRAYWLILPNWISSCLAACFFVAAAITFLVLVLMSVIVIAPM
jgi:hypothetical protein